MTDIVDQVAQRFQHYGLKARQHLSRVRLSHGLALKTLSGNSTDRFDGHLVQLSFDGSRSDEVLAKLPGVVHEIHLVALKANFELFLNRAATVAWHFRLSRIIPESIGRRDEFASLLKKSRLSREELIYAMTGVENAEGAHELLVDKIVPPQGLEALAGCLEIATDVSLHARLDESKNHNVWAQIAVAFEVRNVIEHRDGKVDAKFRRAVGEDWPKSTWGRVSVTELKKVAVEYDDVVATFDAMLRATDLLIPSLVEWCSAVNE